MRYNKKILKVIASLMILELAGELVLPNVAMALTTGPSQPEVQSFEPVGTTDMVNMFTGDFVYNIPLMDVEGYPVNISYHGGVTMEQEASWVGLGWNISPGAINRAVRGVPDDFDGQKLSKELNIKDERVIRAGLGVGAEPLGIGDPYFNLTLDLGAYVNFDNYRGLSCDASLNAGVNLFHCISTGVNIGVGSQAGATIDYNANLSMATSQILSEDMAAGVGIGVSSGYNTRTGIKDLNFTVSPTITDGSISTGSSFSATIPIGIKNFVPVITNSSYMETYNGRLKLGLEAFWVYLNVNVSGMVSVLHHNNDGTRNAYGYLYLQNAANNNDSAILDFTRDKDGMFNKSMQYLPPASMTYDIYSVSGQGTGGSFRPFRNDFGSVYDPVTKTTSSSNTNNVEAGIADLFEVGYDNYQGSSNATSGPWIDYRRQFTPPADKSLYENVYFKQGGELTAVDPAYFSAIHGNNPIDPDIAKQLPNTKPNSDYKRDARGNLIYYLTASEASHSGIGTDPNITSYESANGFAGGPLPDSLKTEYSRYTNSLLGRQKDQISEIIQVQKDGKRYVYGIPAMNNIQKEATFSVNPPNAADLARGLVSYTKDQDDNTSNSNGVDNYYSSTETPSYAHSYLLTSVLSTDYVDVTGNGPTDDDLGSYTKFNYTLKEKDYRWRAPLDTVPKAQYAPGYWSDTRDDKGSYVAGSREEWILHSIETKNYVAEFYTSKRDDAMGTTEKVVNGGTYNLAPYNNSTSDTASSYKLDSIKLYNKHDRFINGNNAVPIKTVIFTYDYSLCQGVPNFRKNTNDTYHGKLTLKKIYIRYGNSDHGMVSPYQFTYDNAYNQPYNLANKDRWGDYKPNPSPLNNFEFPYVNQNDLNNDNYASSWSLTQITLPSGGNIQVNYESDDYAYVQDHPAAEMFMVDGIGNSAYYNGGGGSSLFANSNSPYLYFYFKRRISSENPNLSFADNYMKGLSDLYFNFNVRLRNNYFEQIKGYCSVEQIGPCPDNSDYGYVKVSSVTPTGGGANLNPVSYTTINTARYNIPQILFPGYDPNLSDLDNVLSGLKQAIEELFNISSNPVVQLIQSNDARDVNLSKCFVRLACVGMHKKGGGQRVKSLYFSDDWSQMAGGTQSTAQYGKEYDYTINEPGIGTISSGVASYEPMIGGDENPMHNPVQYTVQSGSHWPPNDPVNLYQEEPIGESLFPSPQVGYRKVTVKSIHSDLGRSSQGIDVYQFYTAKDFPIQKEATGINSTYDNDYSFTSQSNTMTAKQGYTLIFNDMHGKPKSVEHYVYEPQGANTKLISYQQYIYNESGGQLDNNVNTLVYDPGVNRMVLKKKQLGIEEDITTDSRQKIETTHNDNFNANLNCSMAFILPIPLPYVMSWPADYDNEFYSAVTTKVVQQYGILKQVVNFNEGAVTTMTNEVYDPATGDPIVTSMNNEFKDPEYTVNIPAYWGYKYMGPAYTNIGYSESGDNILVTAQTGNGKLYGHLSGSTPQNFNAGDELLTTYTYNGVNDTMLMWVMGSLPISESSSCCDAVVAPRYPTNTPGWAYGNTLSNVTVKVIRSGRRNQLNESIENYTTLDQPWNSNYQLKDTLDELINLKARTYSDNSSEINNSSLLHYQNLDTLNTFAQGIDGIYRLHQEYAYMAPRKYNSTTRTSGLFSAISLWPMNQQSAPCSSNANSYDPNGLYENAVVNTKCDFYSSYLGLNTASDQNWKKARTITKWSPNGKEVENVDAIGDYSTAAYGYNEELPVAVASNAQQGQILTEGFEDYHLLGMLHNLMGFNYSIFKSLFNLQQLNGSAYGVFNNTTADGAVLTRNVSHTGYYSLKTPSSANNSTYPNTYSFIIPYQPNSNQNYISYFPFGVLEGKYILSYWVKAASATATTTTYNLNLTGNNGVEIKTASNGTNQTFNYQVEKKSNIIDGWQQIQIAFTVPTNVTQSVSIAALFPLNYYVDDIRIYPQDANMKAFVYDPVNEKLMATLDENNFATFYEYDQEGSLVRTKKETERGIMTISESRSANPAQ